MAVTAGVIFTAPLLQILYEQNGPTRSRRAGRDADPALLSGALIGFGFVGLSTKKFLTDPTLPAPEARACETMIETAVARPEDRPRLGRSLYAGTIASFLAPLLVKLGLATDHVILASKTVEVDGKERGFQLDLPFTPIYIGIGGLLTLGTALLVFGGSMLRLVGDFMLTQVENGELYPDDSMRWVGGGAMTVAVAYSLVRFLGARTSGAGEDDPLVEVDPGPRKFQIAMIVVGIAMMLAWLVVADGLSTFAIVMSVSLLVCVGLMVVLGAILSLQIGSSASPVSGTIFVTTLVLCVVALRTGRTTIEDVAILTPLLVGACVAVCTANDSSQDYKTMQLCGLRVQEGFTAQLLGLIGGAIVVPITLYIAHGAYGFASTTAEAAAGELAAPQGNMFATLVQGLLLSTETPLPWRPIGIGLAVGVGAVVMDILGQKAKLQLPAMALAVGIYLPPYLGVGMLIGATARWVVERGRAQTDESILTAAGLITGAAVLDLIIGSPDRLRRVQGGAARGPGGRLRVATEHGRVRRNHRARRPALRELARASRLELALLPVRCATRDAGREVSARWSH